MMHFLDIGFKNYVNVDKITSIADPSSNPIKRIRQAAEDKGVYIDVSKGRTVRSIIVTDTHVIGSSVATATLIEKIDKLK